MNPLVLMLSVLAVCVVAIVGIVAAFSAPAHYSQTNPRNAQYEAPRHHP